MPRVGFEPTIPVFERAKTVHALNCAATVAGKMLIFKAPAFVAATALHVGSLCCIDAVYPVFGGHKYRDLSSRWVVGPQAEDLPCKQYYSCDIQRIENRMH
jgi:hypothetical protein